MRRSGEARAEAGPREGAENRDPPFGFAPGAGGIVGMAAGAEPNGPDLEAEAEARGAAPEGAASDPNLRAEALAAVALRTAATEVRRAWLAPRRSATAVSPAVAPGARSVWPAPRRSATAVSPLA